MTTSGRAADASVLTPYGAERVPPAVLREDLQVDQSGNPLIYNPPAPNRRTPSLLPAGRAHRHQQRPVSALHSPGHSIILEIISDVDQRGEACLSCAPARALSRRAARAAPRLNPRDSMPANRSIPSAFRPRSSVEHLMVGSNCSRNRGEMSRNKMPRGESPARLESRLHVRMVIASAGRSWFFFDEPRTAVLLGSSYGPCRGYPHTRVPRQRKSIHRTRPIEKAQGQGRYHNCACVARTDLHAHRCASSSDGLFFPRR